LFGIFISCGLISPLIIFFILELFAWRILSLLVPVTLSSLILYGVVLMSKYKVILNEEGISANVMKANFEQICFTIHWKNLNRIIYVKQSHQILVTADDGKQIVLSKAMLNYKKLLKMLIVKSPSVTYDSWVANKIEHIEID
jgi:hypothetical protein